MYTLFHRQRSNCHATHSTLHDHSGLLKVEADRRELLRHSKLHYRQYTYFQLWGTVIPTVWKLGDWWLTVCIYLLGRLLMHFEVTTNPLVVALDSRYVSIMGGFVSFLLVFYNNQTYARFTSQYEASMRMEGRIFNCAYITRDILPEGIAWQIVRYLNGAHLLGYIGLSEVYKRENTFSPLNAKLRLFTDEEREHLDLINMDVGGSCYREVLGWAVTLIQQARCGTIASVPPIDAQQYQILLSEVLQLRGAIGTLYDFEDQPIPFIYVHLVHFITIVYLLFFAYFVGTSAGVSLVTGIVAVVLFGTIALGILEIGRLMSQPYGDDLSDLSVLHYVNFTWTMSRRILAGKSFVANSSAVERDLEKARPALGAAFEDYASRSKYNPATICQNTESPCRVPSPLPHPLTKSPNIASNLSANLSSVTLPISGTSSLYPSPSMSMAEGEGDRDYRVLTSLHDSSISLMDVTIMTSSIDPDDAMRPAGMNHPSDIV